ncbi:uncharacterized protein LOC114719337 [Neltuma alba]|uniref:uncharacterized protein LOC114714216 n=1 Tax=Neltuma alba TaxID=207710 RepID=UPI0010A3C52C|nr:uncharacterized protein LOC114714216 [Prosopis alba]XP_028760652.1 uncharacterized protein LOC114719337 [Prosopis alba]
MQPPPSLHSNFFSSLRQVEKRLKLEHPPPLPAPAPTKSQTQDGNYSSLGSLSSPMFLHLDQPIASSSSDPCGSEPPRAFLSISPDFPLPDQQHPPHSSPSDRRRPEIEAEDDEIDEIEQLMRLLGLPEEGDEEEGGNDCNSCHCEGGFYSKIAGMKGPKCKKEMKRLDGWIKYFREEKKEPLRLAHLLLGKRVFLSEGGDDDDHGFGGLEFPSTVQEFLHTDPPD